MDSNLVKACVRFHGEHMVSVESLAGGWWMLYSPPIITATHCTTLRCLVPSCRSIWGCYSAEPVAPQSPSPQSEEEMLLIFATEFAQRFSSIQCDCLRWMNSTAWKLQALSFDPVIAIDRNRDLGRWEPWVEWKIKFSEIPNAFPTWSW